MRRAKRSSKLFGRGFEIETKRRFIAGHRGGPCGGADHPSLARSGCAGRSGDCRGGSRRRANSCARRHLLPCRSARRHERILSAAATIIRSTSASSNMARRGWASVFAPATGRLHGGLVGIGAWVEDEKGRDANPHAAEGRSAYGGRVEIAPQSSHNRLSSRGGWRLRLCRNRFVAQILHRRGGRCRHLPARVAHQ